MQWALCRVLEKVKRPGVLGLQVPLGMGHSWPWPLASEVTGHHGYLYLSMPASFQQALKQAWIYLPFSFSSPTFLATNQRYHSIYWWNLTLLPVSPALAADSPMHTWRRPRTLSSPSLQVPSVHIASRKLPGDISMRLLPTHLSPGLQEGIFWGYRSYHLSKGITWFRMPESS